MGPTERLRLARRTIYLALAAVALVVDAGVVRGAAGAGGLIGFAAVTALLVVALVVPRGIAGLHRFAPLAAAALAVATDGTGADSLASAAPRLLVLLFAGLAIEADRALRFARAFADDRAGARLPGSASLLAAVSVALAFDGLLRIVVGPAAGGEAPTTPTGFLVAALAGGTPVHRALVVLFFTVMLLIAFAALDHLRDRAALAAAARAPSGDGLAAFADTRVAAELSRRGDVAAMAGLALESRRLVRALVSFLPLLGFLGTVVGLATAIAALKSAGPGEGGAAAIAASLSGLAVKFETTLLGLGAALVASAALALLERAEGELAVAVRRLAGPRDG